MSTHKKIKTDKELLFGQFGFSSDEMAFYLDTKTGEVVVVSEFDDMEDNAKTKELIESDPDRFVVFPEQDSHEEYNDMVDFANSLEDKHLIEKLAIALSGKGAFRRFKDVLLSYPKEREEWFAYKEKRQQQYFEEWLELEGIEIVDEKKENS
ncbi:MAG: UPF0158 family protein [Candidatus Omnitrophota bacterium]